MKFNLLAGFLLALIVTFPIQATPSSHCTDIKAGIIGIAVDQTSLDLNLGSPVAVTYTFTNLATTYPFAIGPLVPTLEASVSAHDPLITITPLNTTCGGVLNPIKPGIEPRSCQQTVLISTVSTERNHAQLDVKVCDTTGRFCAKSGDCNRVQISINQNSPTPPPPPPPPPPVSNTTLQASVMELALSVNDTATNPALTGNARFVTITNTGTVSTAPLVVSFTPALPAGTSVSGCNGISLAPGASCNVLIQPGALSSCPTDYSIPTASVLTVSASNVVNPASSNIFVIRYTCNFKGGFVFSIDDATTSGDQSIIGKFLATADTSQSPYFWNDPAAIPFGAPDANISGISDNEICSGAGMLATLTGSCNTDTIVSYYTTSSIPPPASNSYAAGLCAQDNLDLPSICELGYGSPPCSALPQTFQNVQANLPSLLSGTYWSSTQSTLNSTPATEAWAFNFSGATPVTLQKSAVQQNIRCISGF